MTGGYEGEENYLRWWSRMAELTVMLVTIFGGVAVAVTGKSDDSGGASSPRVETPVCVFSPLSVCSFCPFFLLLPVYVSWSPYRYPYFFGPFSLNTVCLSLSRSPFPFSAVFSSFFLFSSLLSGLCFIFLSPFSRLASLSVTALLTFSKNFLPLVSFFLFLLLFFCAFLCIYRQLRRGSPYLVQAQGMVVGAWVFYFSSWWGAWVSCLCICRGEEAAQCRSKRCAVCLFVCFFWRKGKWIWEWPKNGLWN